MQIRSIRQILEELIIQFSTQKSKVKSIGDPSTFGNIGVGVIQSSCIIYLIALFIELPRPQGQKIFA